MKLNMKKALLAGTAIVAIGAMAPAAAHAANLTLTAGDVWADGGGTDAGPAAAGDNINIVTFTLTVQNDGVSDDGGGTATFTLGDVTGTTGSVVVRSDAANVDNTATIDSVTITGAGNFTVQNLNADNATVTATVTSDLSIGGALVIDNDENSADDDVILNVGDDLTVTGTTTITAGDVGGAIAALNVDGDAAFTGAVTVTGGTVAATADATVNFAGNATFTGGMALTDGAAGQAIATFDGLTVAQNVTGNITGDGDIIVQNAAGVTFNGTVASGTTVIENGGAALNSAATFKNTVASVITLGAAGTGTNTVTFDIGTTDFTVTGTVDGAIAAETNNVVVTGGSGTLTQATAWGGVAGEIDNLTISGSGTILDSNAAITTKAATGVTTVNSGATLDVGAGLLTSPSVVNNGTLLLSGTGGVTGAITGTGTLDINAAATVTGSITQDDITIAEGITATISAAAGDRTVTADILIEDATSNGTDGVLALTLGNDVTINGDITVGVDGEGAITGSAAAGDISFNGDVGTASKALGAITLAANAAVTTIDTEGNLYVDAITIGQNDVLTLDGDDNTQVVSGTISGTGGGLGAVVVGDGTVNSDVTFNGVIGGTTIATFDVNDGSVARMNANITTGTDITIEGEMILGQNVTAASADVASSVAGNGTLVFTVGNTVAEADDAAILGLTNLDFADFNGGAIFIVPEVTVGTGIIVDGDQFLVMQETGGDSDVANADNTTEIDVADDSALWNFRFLTGENAEITGETVAAEEIWAVADRVNSGSVTDTDNNASAADGVTSIVNTADGDTDLQNVIAAVNSASLADIDEVVEAVQPSIDGSAMAAATTVIDSSLGLISQRVADARNGVDSGMAAGSMGLGNTVWAQAFGTFADQSNRDGIDGYEADTYGFALGVDTENALENGVVGIAFSYGTTDAESDNANSTDTDIDTYQVTLYGTHNFDEVTHMNAMIGYGWNSIDSTRHDIAGIAGLNANADYDANQFVAQVEAGRDYMVDQTRLTPTLLANWTHYSADDYTETGAGGANLDVESDSVNSFELGFDVEAGWKVQNASGSVTEPTVHAGYRYDLIGDEIENTATFTGATSGGVFTVEGYDPARSTFNIGAALSHETTTNWELKASYDYEFKADYDSHSALLRAGYKF